MTSTYSDISSTASRQSGEVRYAIDLLQQVKDKFAENKAVMDQMAMGGDFVTLGAYLGVSAADAEAVYNLWGSANGELVAGVFLNQLLARCG